MVPVAVIVSERLRWARLKEQGIKGRSNSSLADSMDMAADQPHESALLGQFNIQKRLWIGNEEITGE